MPTIYVSDILKEAFPFLSPYIQSSSSKIKKLMSTISFDSQTEKIVDAYSSKAMGTLIYALSNLTYSFVSKRNPSEEEEKIIVGGSLVSLSSSLFDDALDNSMDKLKRAYLVSMADLCSSLGFVLMSQAKIEPTIKSEVFNIAQKFKFESWRANINDHNNKWPTIQTCENSLDVIGLPLEACTRAGAVLSSGDQEYYAELGRAIGQSISLLDCILDTELDLQQGFFSRYPLFFAMKEDPSIKGLIEKNRVKEAFARIKKTNAAQKCKQLLEQKLSKLKKYGLDIHLKSEITI